MVAAAGQHHEDVRRREARGEIAAPEPAAELDMRGDPQLGGERFELGPFGPVTGDDERCDHARFPRRVQPRQQSAHAFRRRQPTCRKQPESTVDGRHRGRREPVQVDAVIDQVAACRDVAESLDRQEALQRGTVAKSRESQRLKHRGKVPRVVRYLMGVHADAERHVDEFAGHRRHLRGLRPVRMDVFAAVRAHEPRDGRRPREAGESARAVRRLPAQTIVERARGSPRRQRRRQGGDEPRSRQIVSALRQLQNRPFELGSIVGVGSGERTDRDLVPACPQLENLAEQHQRDDHRCRFEIDADMSVLITKPVRKDLRRQHRNNAEQKCRASAHSNQGEHVEVHGLERAIAALEKRPAGPQDHGRRDDQLEPESYTLTEELADCGDA